MKSTSDSDQELSANMVFMAKMEKILFDSNESSSPDKETLVEVSYYSSDSESEYEFSESSYYYDNSEFEEEIKVLKEKNDDLLAHTKTLEEQLKVKHVVINSHTECQAQYAKLEEEKQQYVIKFSSFYDNDKQHQIKIDEQDILYDKMSRQLVEMNNNKLKLQEKISEKQTKLLELEVCVLNKDLEIETSKELRPSLYDERVIGLGYTLMFLTHSNEALEIEKFKRTRENKIEFAYDYGNLNEKIKFSDDYYQEIINLCFEKINSPVQQTSSLKPYVQNVILEKIIINLEDEVVSLLKKEKENFEITESLKSKGFVLSENANFESENQNEKECQVVEFGCDKLENSKIIAPGMFRIQVSQNVSPVSVSKTSCASNKIENKTKRKRRKRTSSKYNDKQVNNDFLYANRDFVHFSNLDIYSSVRRPTCSDVIWHNKGLSNASCIDLSSLRNSNLNKDVKRYSRKDLLSCNNSHHVNTNYAYMCNDAMNVSCNSRLHASYDMNDMYVFDDVNLKLHLDDALELIISFIKKTQVNLQFQVQRVRTDNGIEFKNKILAKFFAETTKSPTTNVATSVEEISPSEEVVFHEISESFPKEYSSSSLTEDVQQSSEEVVIPSSNTQSVTNDIVPNVVEAFESFSSRGGIFFIFH
ncbi:hypothetical protein Tco_1494007 [Tanacetum coccineum]